MRKAFLCKLWALASDLALQRRPSDLKLKSGVIDARP